MLLPRRRSPRAPGASFWLAAGDRDSQRGMPGPLIASCAQRHYIAAVSRRPFIPPSLPVLAQSPPVGREWLHEVKHDGWRVQLHKAGDDVVVYSKTGADFTKRFRAIADAILKLSATSCILDAEVVACDAEGNPDFAELMRGAPHGCCAWCFDLMELDGTNHTMAPLEYRRHLLGKLLKRGKSGTLRLSENFRDPIALLKAAETHGLEGIVSKLREDRYRSGKNPGWVKVKTAIWRAATRERHNLFEKG
jgi:bifunctional non-homologous end joining protein LigD